MVGARELGALALEGAQALLQVRGEGVECASHLRDLVVPGEADAVVELPAAQGLGALAQPPQPAGQEQPEQHRGEDGQGELGGGDARVLQAGGARQRLDLGDGVAGAQRPEGLAGQLDPAGDVVDAVAARVGVDAVRRRQRVRRAAEARHAAPVAVEDHGIGQVALGVEQVQGVEHRGAVLGGEPGSDEGGEQQALLARGALEQLGVAGADQPHAVPHQHRQHDGLDEHHPQDEAGGEPRPRQPPHGGAALCR